MIAQRRYGLLAALILASGQAFAQAPAAVPTPTQAPIQAPIQAPAGVAASGPKTIGVPQGRRYSSALIVTNAKAGRLEGDKLILDGVQPTATLFTSRPVRTVGHMPTPQMVELWRTGSFAKDPPNATASVFSKDGASVSDVVLVLKAAKLDGDKLTFDVQVLEGSLGRADGPASVFIDTIWFGVGSNGFSYYGQSQTTGGETPDIGDPDGTSTFSGWSNPSPTHPYAPAPQPTYGSPIGAPPPPDVDPRYRKSFNQPTCGNPPLLPCY